MAEILLEKLENHAAAYHSLSALARVRISSSDGNIGGRQVLLVETPDRLRVEVLSPFGQPLAILAANGNELAFWNISEGRMHVGKSTSGTIQRLMGLPLKLSDLTGILLYRPPVIPHASPSVLPAEEGGYLMILRGGEGWMQRLLFDRTLNLNRTEYRRSDHAVLIVEYSNFKENDPFPRRMSVRMPGREAEATISLPEPDINPDLPRERFTLEPPPEVRILPFPENEKIPNISNIPEDTE